MTVSSFRALIIVAVASSLAAQQRAARRPAANAARSPAAQANPATGQRSDSTSGDSTARGGGGGGPFGGLRFRSIGPALTSGRISDIAVNPRDKKIWYVASASGGLWKTTNAG